MPDLNATTLDAARTRYRTLLGFMSTGTRTIAETQRQLGAAAEVIAMLFSYIDTQATALAVAEADDDTADIAYSAIATEKARVAWEDNMADTDLGNAYVAARQNESDVIQCYLLDVAPEVGK